MKVLRHPGHGRIKYRVECTDLYLRETKQLNSTEEVVCHDKTDLRIQISTFSTEKMEGLREKRRKLSMLNWKEHH